MNRKDNEYGAERIAELFGNYIRLRKKVKDLSVDELKRSQDYRQLLRIEHNLRSLILTGETLVEMGDFAHLILGVDYQRLKEEYQAFYKVLNDRYPQIRSRLEEALKPFPALLKLSKE